MKKVLKLRSAVKLLEQLYPLSWAEDWDNVGLLIEPKGNPDIRKVLLAIDLTEGVLKEAKSQRAELIIAYHPIIFDPLTRITSAAPKERIVRDLIAAGIAVYSPHTALDAAPGGVNDWLADAVGEGDRTCLHPLEDSGGYVGQGRLVTLDKPASLRTLAQRIRQNLRLKHLRIAWAPRHRAAGAKVRTIALCAGAGHSVLENVDADVYLTGEMRHHDVLAATEMGSSVILCEHTNSERGYLRILKKSLVKVFGGSVQIVVSKEDREPLSIV